LAYKGSGLLLLTRLNPPELWQAYLLKFLDSYTYFFLSLVLALSLSDKFGMTDVRAGAAYGLWRALVTIYGLLAGAVVDNLRVAACLSMGFAQILLVRIAPFLTNPTGSYLLAYSSACPWPAALACSCSPSACGGTPQKRTGDLPSGCPNAPAFLLPPPDDDAE
jgi:hypothetical protein